MAACCYSQSSPGVILELFCEAVSEAAAGRETPGSLAEFKWMPGCWLPGKGLINMKAFKFRQVSAELKSAMKDDIISKRRSHHGCMKKQQQHCSADAAEWLRWISSLLLVLMSVRLPSSRAPVVGQWQN